MKSRPRDHRDDELATLQVDSNSEFPLGRYSLPEDIDDAAVFLTSDDSTAVVEDIMAINRANPSDRWPNEILRALQANAPTMVNLPVLVTDTVVYLTRPVRVTSPIKTPPRACLGFARVQRYRDRSWQMEAQKNRRRMDSHLHIHRHLSHQRWFV